MMTRRRALAYSPPSAGERIFVADIQGGISYSDDNGETWTRVTVASAPTPIFDVARGQDGVICAAGNYGSYTGEIMRSTDNGENYTLVDISGSAASKLRNIFTDGEGKWFAQGDNGTDELYGSTDNGATWSKVKNLGTGADAARWAGAYANGLYIIAAKGNNYWTSTNGTSWTRRTDMGHTDEIRSIKYLNGKWFAVGRVTMSETGVGDWTYVATTPAAVHWDITWNGSVYVLVGVYSSTYATVFTSSNGTDWTDVTDMHLTGFTGMGITALPSGRLVAAFYQSATPTNGRIYTSDDNGESWDLRVNSTSYGYTRLA